MNTLVCVYLESEVPLIPHNFVRNPFYFQRDLIHSNHEVFPNHKVHWWRNCVFSNIPEFSDQMEIFRGDSHPFSMDSHQIWILHKAHKECLTCFLKCSQGLNLESQVGFVILSNFPNNSAEGKLWNEQITAFLPETNLSQGNCKETEWEVPLITKVGLFLRHPTCSGSESSLFRSRLLPRRRTL